MDSVLKRALKGIIPTKKEEKDMQKISRKLLIAVGKFADKHNADTILAGSITRNTWLKEKKEIDIFVAFPDNLPDKDLATIGLQIGKAAIKSMGGRHIISYAQHPYVRGFVGKYQVDIVPCYKLDSADKIKSAVDRTPFHVKFIEKNMRSEQANDVRLLKQFCKSAGVYGADLKTEGLSGYMCDLLIIKYGSFSNTIKNISNWKAGSVITLQNEVAQKFENAPLVLIDPVDSKRNVAAAVSPKNFEFLVSRAKNFCKKPSDKFFTIQKRKPMERPEFLKLKKLRGTSVIAVAFKPPKVVSDILWPQMRRFVERMGQMLRENDFKPMNCAGWSDEKNIAIAIFEMEVNNLPNIKKKVGPSVFAHTNSQNFIEHYAKNPVRKPYVEGVNWVVETGRKHVNAAYYMLDVLKQNQKTLEAVGIPSHIAEYICKGSKIAVDEKIYGLIKNNKEAKTFIRNFFGYVS
ncbi:MAG: CCA tRNA nucleotidyltransferase [Candidatus Aenigmarchaeota archaeon]|nr:CCA tRNA nucleotidyltransferase [Candidatus Aenigmarchaeota archaeon]